MKVYLLVISLFIIGVILFVFSMMKVAKDSDERAKKIYNTCQQPTTLKG